MSAAPVYVLAVMRRDSLDASIRRQWDDLTYAEQCSVESETARAAVSELIAAAESVYGEPCVDEAQAADDPCPPDCMSCRIRAALRRCTGEGA